MNRMYKAADFTDATDQINEFVSLMEEGEDDVIASNITLISENVFRDFGEYVIPYAAQYDMSPKVFDMLLAKGCNINAQMGEQGGALAIGGEATVKHLLLRGAYLEAVNFDGMTALHIASRDNDQDHTRLLLSLNANIHAVDDNGNTPLHVCSGIETAGVLVELGCNVNAKNFGEWTPLHYAASCNRSDVVALLLTCGADPALKNLTGQTARDCALQGTSCDDSIRVIHSFTSKNSLTKELSWKPGDCKSDTPHNQQEHAQKRRRLL